MTRNNAHPIRYSRLGYARLQVTDMAASVNFYENLVGLKGDAGPNGEVWLRCSDKPYDLILTEGPDAGLAAVGFELESRNELDKAFSHVSACGYNPEWVSAGEAATRKVEAGFSFANPDTGLLVDFYVGQAIATEPFEPTVAKIARLGHVVLNVSDYSRAHKFWIEDLGFAISDHVPGRIAFIRAWPNSLHHTFALLQGEKDTLNHVNFMVTDIDDVGKAMNRMKKNDVPIVFGPGRHLPSTSIFIYYLDPDQMTVEYSFGMEEIEEVGGREPRVLEPKPEVLDTWGSLPDPRFGKTGKILAHHG
jgi:2,3-dihydroxy-p-cumate/2,3-dihydroxybenzoate 3,4-dioxygenase